MRRTNVYLTQEQELKIKSQATIAQKPRAVILREIIDRGLKAGAQQKSASTETFLKLADIAEKFKGKGAAPKDLSSNLDKYIWDDE